MQQLLNCIQMQISIFKKGECNKYFNMSANYITIILRNLRIIETELKSIVFIMNQFA